MIIIISSLFFLQHAVMISGDCVWYGECNTDMSGKIQNCAYEGPPKYLSDSQSILTLRNLCPSLIINGYGNGTKLCCDSNQIKTMENGFSLLKGFFGRCPSCVQNLFKIYCDITCSPEQRNFMRIGKKEGNSTMEYVTSLNVYISQKYINDVYDSCKKVTAPSIGKKVIDIACGIWTSTRCNANRWFEYMGSHSDQNPYSPFEMKFITNNNNNDSSIIPRNLKTTSCSSPLDDGTAACGCIDCEASCTIPLMNNEDQPHSELQDYNDWLLNYNLPALLSLTIFVIIFIALICNHLFPYKTVKKNHTEDGLEFEENKKNPVKHIENAFGFIATVCATHPIQVLLFSGCIMGLLSLGIFRVQLTTDPVELWSSKDSECRQHKEYYDKHFGPFYRIQQVILKSNQFKKLTHNTPNGIHEFGDVFEEQFMIETKKLQDSLMNLGQPNDGLEKICFSPLSPVNTKPSSVKGCLVYSVWGYFQNNNQTFQTSRNLTGGFVYNYLDHFTMCAQNNFNPSCLGEYGGPIDTSLVIGGFQDNSFENASALILTFLLNNYYDKDMVKPALKWENSFLEFMKNWETYEKPSFMDVSYMSESSVESELNKQTISQGIVIAISYIMMFIYVTLSLGHVRSFSQFLVGNKILLGISGVCIVIMAVVAAVGFYGFVGVPVTLIVIEVIPFLVLAIGVDNIFIIVEAQREIARKPNETIQQHMSRVMKSVGPKILVTSASESCCFFLGTLSNMPAVKSFALYAGMAVIFDFILQITVFVSIISLDTKRRENLEKRSNSIKIKVEEIPTSGFLSKFFKNIYSPLITHGLSRPVIILMFTAWFCTSLAFIGNIEIGLDQELAVPTDSYLFTYFQDIKRYLSVGPPVYFVVKNMKNMSENEAQNSICAGQHCDTDSLVNVIYAASNLPNLTYIAKPPSSWIDDYFDWLANPQCCKITAQNTFCPHSDENCESCSIDFNKTTGRPSSNDFEKYLPFFLSDSPDYMCAKGGHAAYGQSVKYTTNGDKTDISSSSFMTYHTILKKSSDYYNALEQAKLLSNSLTKIIRDKVGPNSTAEVFPYSIFYIFYEQYLTMWPDALESISISLISVFFVTYIFTGFNLSSATIIIITIFMIIMNLWSFMIIMNIQLNAVSLVNLVMAVGISVEFCSHLVQRYTSSEEISRINKVHDALSSVGSCVFSGITMTKLTGIIVLAFSSSQIFRILYFQMYLGIIFIGALHGLIFLPVFLTYVGHRNVKIKKEIMEDTAINLI